MRKTSTRATVAAVCEDVNELKWCVIPLLASPQGGEAASSRKCCEATEADAAGVVFLCVLNRKTTPTSRLADASRHFINRSAPLLAVMQGGEYARFHSFTPS